MAFKFKKTNDPAVSELHIVDGIRDDRDAMGRNFDAQLNALSPSVRELIVRINSLGGHSHIAIRMHDALRGCGRRIITSIEGFAFSAAATVSQAGSTRRMAADGIFQAHPSVLTVDLSVVPSGVAVFPANDLRKYADQLDAMTEHTIDLFTARSGRDRADVRALFEREEHLNAPEALEAGLIDEITPPRRLPSAHDDNWQTMHFAEKARAANLRREASEQQP